MSLDLNKTTSVIETLELEELSESESQQVIGGVGAMINLDYGPPGESMNFGQIIVRFDPGGVRLGNGSPVDDDV